MKKISIKLLAVLFLTTIFFACGNNSDNENNIAAENDTSVNNNVTENNADIGKKDTVTEEPSVNKKVFDKFEDYAEIKTKKDLIAQFGEDNLKDGTEYYAEGTMERKSTTLTNPENKNVIKYIWKDNNDSTAWIEADYRLFDENYNITGNQKIKARNGLYFGMSLKELRDWNGADFKFYGFGWDYGGSIIAKEGSKLKESPIEVSLEMQGKQDDFNFAVGDVELSADDPRLKDAGIIVTSFSMYVK